MATNPRTTAGLIGDLLATMPGSYIALSAAAERIERDRSGLDRAADLLSKAGAIQVQPDPTAKNQAGRPRNVLSMTSEQAHAWKKDEGRTVAAAAGINLEVAPVASKAAAAIVKARQARQDVRLRFGVWSDGALAIEGLARKQLMLSAMETGALATTLASLPEGALQALFESSLKPVFTLHVEGRDYPLTTEQTADLVAYIEQLPAKALRTPSAPGLKHGTDHRVHRLGDDDGDTAGQ